MDWHQIITTYSVGLPLMGADVMLAMCAIIVLCLISCGAWKVIDVLSSVNASIPTEFSAGGEGASSYQDQYQDSLRGSRSGSLYVPGGGVEAGIDPGAERFGSPYKDKVPYQTAEKFAGPAEEIELVAETQAVKSIALKAAPIV